VFIAALLLAAEVPATQTIPDPAAATDPMICRREKVIGSLLQVKKTCMRKSEWMAERELNRQAIEKAQVQRDSGSPAG
jgi:hypothetical protein